MHNLFSVFDKLKPVIKNNPLFIFLDYDGTLVPIKEIPDPEKSLLSDRGRRLLLELSKLRDCKVAVISGRSLCDVKRMAGVEGLVYSGNHGLELEGPKIKFEVPLNEAYRKAISKLKKELLDKLGGIRGAFVEDKRLTLSVHYRLVKEELLPLVKAAVKETAGPFVQKKIIRLNAGKNVFEIKPCVKWDKGKLVLWLLARQAFVNGGSMPLPVYIGDDMTDEDAFRVLRRKGITVFVGKPHGSAAEYYVKSPPEVRELLMRIARIKKEEMLCRNQ